MSKPELSIIIVSWNVRELLKKCLASIAQYQKDLAVEVIVIDNASNDHSAEMVLQNFPSATLIANNHNAGFARANNQGIMQAQGDFILLLNPDTEITKDSLQQMLTFAKQKEKVGIVGCRHLNTNLTIQHSVRRFPTMLAMLLIFFKIEKILPGVGALEKYYAKDFDYKKSAPVDQVAGSCMLIRRELLDDVGILDENFFIWFEEVDLCKRAHNAGWEVWYDTTPKIIHHGGQSFSQQMTAEKQIRFFKSALYYFKKHLF